MCILELFFDWSIKYKISSQTCKRYLKSDHFSPPPLLCVGFKHPWSVSYVSCACPTSQWPIFLTDPIQVRSCQVIGLLCSKSFRSESCWSWIISTRGLIILLCVYVIKIFHDIKLSWKPSNSQSLYNRIQGPGQSDTSPTPISSLMFFLTTAMKRHQSRCCSWSCQLSSHLRASVRAVSSA